MCDPTMLAIASIGTSVLGTVQSARAAGQASSDTRAAHNFNAQVQEAQAVDALSRGAKDVVRHRMKTQQLKGRQRAAMAANGIAIDSGSALDILASTDILSEMDSQVIMENAEREAAGHRSGADMSRFYAGQQNPSLARNSMLLSGAGSVASKWYGFQQSGAFG